MERRGQAAAGMGLGGCVCSCLVVYLILGIGFIDPTEMALTYNVFFSTLSPTVRLQPGMTWVGPFNSLVKYPKTIQTIQFDKSHADELDGRTQDGLPLFLEVSFQYQLMPDQLHQLYTEYESETYDYLKMYKLMGIHLITEMATNYSAYEFFNNKQMIAEDMQYHMDKYFRQNLHAKVLSLQINQDTLPTPFTDMILKAATMKQGISRTHKTLNAKVVQMQTYVKVAQAQANITIQKAIGESALVEQNGIADATVIRAFVGSELEAYNKMKGSLGLKGESLLKYIWYDAVGGGGVIQPGQEFSVFSGVNPGAYMTAS